jgi:hypothetical protein
MLTRSRAQKISDGRAGCKLRYRSLAELSDRQVRYRDVGCKYDIKLKRYLEKEHQRSRIGPEQRRFDEADFSGSERLLFAERFPLPHTTYTSEPRALDTTVND